MEHERDRKMHSSNGEKSKFRELSESFLVALGIALLIRALVIYPFRIPTSSMEGSLLVGDFLLANKFVYGIRTPDWIGIPYTKLGFSIPFTRTPGFREPQRGDVVIFKYPQNETDNYIKRCIALSGDTLEIRDKSVYVNGKAFATAKKQQHIDRNVYIPGFRENGIYPPGAGNRDNYGPVRIPAPGDTFQFTLSNKDRWFERFQIIVYEGHKLTLTHGSETIRLTVKNQNKWQQAIQKFSIEDFSIDGRSLKDLVYTIKNKHYFMMGDNRDNSLDSRYWGFLPERNIVGEALVIYWSWDSEMPLYRLFNKVRWGRIFNLIR